MTFNTAGRFLIPLLLGLALLVGGPSLSVAAQRPVEPGWLVGAYYYLWYPENWRSGWLRAKLNPPQPPLAGVYESRWPSVAENHIAMCSRYGLDFLAVSWWPGAAEQNKRLTDGFLKAANLSDIKWCLLYESYALNWHPEWGATVFDGATADRFVAEMIDLADRFFGHPAYLKVNGRPVVILYLTRTFIGQYAEALARARAALRAKGLEPYFIADEVFWATASQEMAGRMASDGGPIEPRLTIARDPQPERIKLFDALTAYNVYEGGLTQHAGYGAKSRFVADTAELYRRYARAAQAGGVKFVPNILPGYNDRGDRAEQGHFVIPRQWAADEPTGSFLDQSFRRLALPFTDPDLGMILITSFNEWNEDTGIEPLRPAPATSRDQSPSGRLYTQGYDYQGYMYRQLEVVRDQTAALAGRLTNRRGKGLAGRKITLSQAGRPKAEDLTDRQGYFTLSRRRVTPGPARVSWGQGHGRAVTIPADGPCPVVELKGD